MLKFFYRAMKLKLEAQNSVTILTVSEAVTPQDIAVLRAGVNKLIQGGKKSILLDAIAVPNECAPALQEVAGFQNFVQDANAQLIVASPLQGVGHAPTRPEALQVLQSPLANLLSLEAKLQYQIKELEKQKSTIEQKLAAAPSGEGDVKTLQKENSRIKALIKDLEKQIEKKLKSRKEPWKPDELSQAKAETLRRTLTAVLEQEGVLPVT